LHIGVPERALYLLAPILIAFAIGMHQLPGVIAGGLTGPDSYMRLVRLEDTLRQHEIAYVVARDGSGAGTLLHWSHLLDLLLSLLAAPLRLAFDDHAALHAAATVFGPLWIGALGLATAWAAAPLSEPRWRWLAPLVVVVSAPIVSYGVPGVVHHHVPLLLVAVMTAGYALRGTLAMAAPGAGLAMGAWAGLGIWLSPEAMPFILMAFGGLWLAWTLQPRPDLVAMIVRAAIGFLLVVAGAFAVDPPYAGYASVEIDRISLVYVVLAGVVVAMAGAAVMVEHSSQRGRRRTAIRLIVPVLCLGAWIAVFPALLRGTAGLMTAPETQALFGTISEMMPVHSVGAAIAFLLTGTLTAGAAGWFALSRRSLLLAYVALCAGVLALLGAVHVRFAAYPAAAAAAMLPVLVTSCTVALRRWPEAVQAAARIGLIALFALVPLVGLLAPVSVDENDHACALSGSEGMLAKHAGQVVLANPNDTPELLYRTRALTVGSLYHRNIVAFMRLRAAWRSLPSDTVPDAVRSTGATLVLYCSSAARSLLVADLPLDTLLDRMNQGLVPSWLHRLDADPHAGYVLYQVLPPDQPTR
jgi:hypothetical protein